MNEDRMYAMRPKNGNIAVMRYCGYSCIYCAFKKFQKISPCLKCRAGENHTHIEVLNRKPPKCSSKQILTVGLSGDVSFMPIASFIEVLEYCRKWDDRTFLIQSKNPAYFLTFQDKFKIAIPDNVIIGTTIETNDDFLYNAGTGINISYKCISQAPYPYDRFAAMRELACRKAITIEPLLDFKVDNLSHRIIDLTPEIVWVGYANDNKNGKRLRLPEPPLAKTLELIERLEKAGIKVVKKSIRKAWYE